MPSSPLSGPRPRSSAENSIRWHTRQRVPHCKPALEPLEDRTLLDAGFLDPTFGTGGKVLTDFPGTPSDQARAVAVQTDGKLVVAGTVGNGQATSFGLARYLTTGALDTTFGTGGRVTTAFDAPSRANALVLQADGKIVVAGGTGLGAKVAVARYNADGSLDGAYGTGGKTTFTFPGAPRIGQDGGESFGLALQGDGKLVLVGACTSFVIARLNPDGSLDGGFGNGGRVGECYMVGHSRVLSARVALQSDGKLLAATVVTGSASSIFLQRYHANGSLDNTFAGGVVATGLGIDFGMAGPGLRVQADGKILVAGTLPTPNVTPLQPGAGFGVARFNADGTLDTGFGGGRVTVDFAGLDSAADVLVQADGKILVVGSSTGLNGVGFTGLIVTRLLPNGTLNTSFGITGKVSVAAAGVSLDGPAVQGVLLADGKLAVVGTTLGTDTGSDFLTTRFNLTDTLTTENQRYVGQLYLNLLGRSADPTGLAAYTNLLDRGTANRTQVAQTILGSEEYRTVVVKNLYRTILGREADPGGLSSYVGFLRTGGTVAEAKARMFGSVEYFQNRTDRTPSGFVTALYRDVLGRETDPTGLQGYTKQLADGATQTAVSFRVVASREGVEKVVQGVYRQYLRRAADAAGLKGFTDFLVTGGREDTAISIVLSSAEFARGL